LKEKNPPHHNWSDGSHAYDVAGPAGPATDPITLYRDAVADWFGQSGLAALLGAGSEAAKSTAKSSSKPTSGGGQR
jgi:hypothetical protein